MISIIVMIYLFVFFLLYIFFLIENNINALFAVTRIGKSREYYEVMLKKLNGYYDKEEQKKLH